jgi:hypothetical protein
MHGASFFFAGTIASTIHHPHQTLFSIEQLYV